jgi:hypothetical protein
MDVQEAGGYPVNVEGRGKWVDVTQDSQGNWNFNGVRDRRTPAFKQTDFSFVHNHTVNPERGMVLGFEANITNLWNQRSVVEYYSQMNSSFQGSAIQPSDTLDYSVLMHAYDYKSLVNSQQVNASSLYGKPYSYQGGRGIRLKLRFDF